MELIIVSFRESLDETTQQGDFSPDDFSMMDFSTEGVEDDPDAGSITVGGLATSVDEEVLSQAGLSATQDITSIEFGAFRPLLDQSQRVRYGFFKGRGHEILGKRLLPDEGRIRYTFLRVQG